MDKDLKWGFAPTNISTSSRQIFDQGPAILFAGIRVIYLQFSPAYHDLPQFIRHLCDGVGLLTVALIASEKGGRKPRVADPAPSGLLRLASL